MAKIADPLPAGPTTEAHIAAFEAYIGHKLPADYRQFLLEHNGGHPEPDAFLLNAGYGEEEDIVMCFFPMGDLKLGSVTVGDPEELRTWPLHCAWKDLQNDLENLHLGFMRHEGVTGGPRPAFPSVMQPKRDPVARSVLRRLLDDFDAIESEHGEVYETDVREAIWLCLRNVLLIPRPGYQIPRAFEMVTAEGNAMVAAALDRFLSHPDAVALAGSALSPAERLGAFQDESIRSAYGHSLNETIGLCDAP